MINIDDDAQELINSTNEMARETFEKTNKMRDFLKTLATMYNISYNNILLLKSQRENVSFIATEEEGVTTYYGGYLHVDNLSSNTPVDMRMTFPKELIMIDHPFLKKSGVDGLDKILAVEQERADEANRIREVARKNLTIFYYFKL